jgi:DNA-binding MarR family transcriptional regulator
MPDLKERQRVGNRGAKRAKASRPDKSKTILRTDGRSRRPAEPAADVVAARSQIDHIDFGQLASLVGYRIRRAYGRVFQSFNEMFEPLNIAFGQFSVLTLIGLNPGLSQMALADASDIDRSTIVPITDRFVRLGWVRRTRRPEDRRVYSLRVTPTGRAVLDRAQAAISAHDEMLASGLTAEERAQLIDLLARINREQNPSLRPKHAVPPRSTP